MHMLDLIVANHTDASETLAPPGVGGNITEPEKVRSVLGGKVAMIGGMDQFNILTSGTAGEIRRETHRLFEGFGKNGGYICSASDHFFDTPVDKVLADIKAQYTIGYVSTNAGTDGKWRKVEIRVKRPGLKTRTRQGYFAPYRRQP